jgi:hypothetical protein
MRLNPVREGLLKASEDGRWSIYNDFALDNSMVEVGPIHIDPVRVPLGYWA